MVCIDLSSTYRSIVKKHFPNARIVADRFHVIRLLQHQCMMTYRELAPNVKSNRGILPLLRKRPDKLTTKKRIKKDAFLEENPVVKAVYDFQQQLHQLLLYKAMTKKWCRKAIPKFLNVVKELKQSPFKALASLGRTFYLWRDEIACIWRFRKSNGITEGFHRKMKLIHRSAYGFRNFENYRTRVRVLCC